MQMVCDVSGQSQGAQSLAVGSFLGPCVLLFVPAALSLDTSICASGRSSPS